MQHLGMRVTNLVIALARRELALLDEHPESEEEHDESMTEGDSEEAAKNASAEIYMYATMLAEQHKEKPLWASKKLKLFAHMITT